MFSILQQSDTERAIAVPQVRCWVKVTGVNVMFCQGCRASAIMVQHAISDISTKKLLRPTKLQPLTTKLFAEANPEPEVQEPSFVPFRGSGMRLDGRTSSSATASSLPSSSASAGEVSPAGMHRLLAVRVSYEAMKVLCACCSTGQGPWPHVPTFQLLLECYGLHVPCEPCWLHADNYQDVKLHVQPFTESRRWQPLCTLSSTRSGHSETSLCVSLSCCRQCPELIVAPVGPSSRQAGSSAAPGRTTSNGAAAAPKQKAGKVVFAGGNRLAAKQAAAKEQKVCSYCKCPLVLCHPAMPACDKLQSLTSSQVINVQLRLYKSVYMSSCRRLNLPRKRRRRNLQVSLHSLGKADH